MILVMGCWFISNLFSYIILCEYILHSQGIVNSSYFCIVIYNCPKCIVYKQRTVMDWEILYEIAIWNRQVIRIYMMGNCTGKLGD